MLKKNHHEINKKKCRAKNVEKFRAIIAKNQEKLGKNKQKMGKIEKEISKKFKN